MPKHCLLDLGLPFKWKVYVSLFQAAKVRGLVSCYQELYGQSNQQLCLMSFCDISLCIILGTELLITQII